MKKTAAAVLTAAVTACALTVSVFGSINMEAYRVQANINADSFAEGYARILDEYKEAYKDAKESFSNGLFEKYPDVSSEYMLQAGSMGEPMYALRDLDENGVPELLVCACRTGTSDTYFINGIYSYRQNQVTNDFVRAGNIFAEILDTNEVYAAIPATMYSYYVTFDYNEGSFTKTDDISNEFNGGLTHNGMAISESEYYALLSEKTAHTARLDWKSADEFSAETAPETAPAESITVLLKGEELVFGVEPYIENGVTMVPMRTVFEALGASVDYEGSTKTITAVKDDTTIILTVGSTQASKNGETVVLQNAAEIVDGSAMVPLRFVSEGLGAEVSWNGDTKTVAID